MKAQPVCETQIEITEGRIHTANCCLAIMCKASQWNSGSRHQEGCFLAAAGHAKAQGGAKKRNSCLRSPGKALPSFLVTAQLKRKPPLPISQSCCRCSEALIIPKRSLVGLHVPPRNGFVFISLLKIFSVRLDVKNPSLSCIGGVRGTGSCRHNPNLVGSSGDININAYTASIKVMSQEQIDRLQCTGLSRNEQICLSKKSFSWHLVCSLFYFCF